MRKIIQVIQMNLVKTNSSFNFVKKKNYGMAKTDLWN
jgi:hypothetical protein